ncbi:Lipoprotein SmpA/OmlA domain-containing protein [Desulfarculales bacterium]
MSKKVLALVLILGLVLTAGCVAPAKEQFAKLQVGMSKPQVTHTIGEPEKVDYVRFKGHDSDYEIWQYQMVPDTPLCPSEAIPRFVTDVATLGLAEIAWTRVKADAHWIYFLDGALVYTSPAFDCLDGELCKMRRGASPQKESRLRQ